MTLPGRHWRTDAHDDDTSPRGKHITQKDHHKAVGVTNNIGKRADKLYLTILSRETSSLPTEPKPRLVFRRNRPSQVQRQYQIFPV